MYSDSEFSIDADGNTVHSQDDGAGPTASGRNNHVVPPNNRTARVAPQTANNASSILSSQSRDHPAWRSSSMRSADNDSNQSFGGGSANTPYTAPMPPSLTTSIP